MTYLAMIQVSSRANTTAAMISASAGTSGFSAIGRMYVIIETASSLTDEAEDEGQGDADDGERLGQREADERRAQHRAPGLGLTGGALDDSGEDQADAD